METRLYNMEVILSQAFGTLPSQTEGNPKKKEVNVVSTRSRRPMTELKKKGANHFPPQKEILTKGSLDAEKEGKKQVLTPPQVSITFSQRVQDKSEDGQFDKFVKMMKILHINIIFAEAVSQKPKYIKYLKEIISNKGKLADFATIGLNEGCFVVVLKKLSPKLKDPKSFSVPCEVGNLHFDSALCDLGARINLMPYFCS